MRPESFFILHDGLAKGTHTRPACCASCAPWVNAYRHAGSWAKPNSRKYTEKTGGPAPSEPRLLHPKGTLRPHAAESANRRRDFQAHDLWLQDLLLRCSSVVSICKITASSCMPDRLLQGKNCLDEIIRQLSARRCCSMVR